MNNIIGINAFDDVDDFRLRDILLIKVNWETVNVGAVSRS